MLLVGAALVAAGGSGVGDALVVGVGVAAGGALQPASVRMMAATINRRCTVVLYLTWDDARV
jgi:hypothetical protein